MVSDYIKKLFKTRKKVIRLYRNCSELSMYNFDMIYKTDDYRHLVVGWDGYNEIELPEEINKVWTNIFDEWVKLSDNNEIIYYYQLMSEIRYLETRYVVAETLLLQIYQRDMDEKTLDMYIEMLKNWKYIYNKGGEKVTELTRLFAQHKASFNKISIKRSELELMQDKSEGKGNTSLESQAVILEQITGRNNIDTKNISVMKWIEICKIADNINTQRKKHHG